MGLREVFNKKSAHSGVISLREKVKEDYTTINVRSYRKTERDNNTPSI